MPSHNFTHDSAIQQFADRHPLLFLPFHIAKGKLSKPKSPTRKAENIFEDAEYREDNELIAKLTHYEDFPVVEVYTDDPALKAKARTHLTAKYLMQFYIKYIQYMPVAARLTGSIRKDPFTFTNDEINRRQLDLSFVDVELHQMLKEYNACVAEYNRTKSSLLHINYFTLDDLKALTALCDVYKGIGACTAGVTKEKRADGTEASYFIRNLDWKSLNILGDYSHGTMTLTGHKEAHKPKAVFSIGFTPGLHGLSLVNDRGLIVTINEASLMNTKRENPQLNATPQFILTRKIIENCSTIAEVKKFLETNQPATSHILMVMDAEGSSGVFEMLPNTGPYKNKLYRFRGYDKTDPGSDLVQGQYVTNHFLDEKGNPLLSTDKEHLGRLENDSFERFNKISAGMARHDSPLDIAKSTCSERSVQTLIFRKDNNGLTIDLNIANGFSAQALDHQGKKQHYTHINLSEKFKSFIDETNKNKISKEITDEIDASLINLMQVSHRVGRYNPDLSRNISKLYSKLSLELSKKQVQQPLLTPEKIKCMADETANVVDKVFSHNLDLKGKQEAIKNYVKATQPIYALLPSGSSFMDVVLDSLSRFFRLSVYSTSGLTTFGNRMGSQLESSAKTEAKEMKRSPLSH